MELELIFEIGWNFANEKTLNFDDDPIFLPDALQEAKNSFLWQLCESAKVPEVESVHPDHTKFDFVLAFPNDEVHFCCNEFLV